MASARISANAKCSKCKNTAGAFNCPGCKEMFCSRHSIEHRQDLSTRFEELMTQHNITLQQMQERQPLKQLLKKDFDAQIDEWKNTMIEKVCQRAEEIRQQFDQQMDRKDETMMKNIRLLTDEIHQRLEKEDFFEQDIERIQQNIIESQQAIEKSTQQSDIELCIEPNEKVDWENLIYIQEKPNSTTSSVTKKDEKKSSTTMNSNQIYDPSRSLPPYNIPMAPFMFTPPVLHPLLVPINRSPNESNSAVNLPLQSYPRPSPPSNLYASNVSSSAEKRQRKPLAIVDPRTCEAIGINAFADTNRNSSQAASINSTSNPTSSSLSEAAEKPRPEEKFRTQFDEISSDKKNSHT